MKYNPRKPNSERLTHKVSAPSKHYAWHIVGSQSVLANVFTTEESSLRTLKD